MRAKSVFPKRMSPGNLFYSPGTCGRSYGLLAKAFHTDTRLGLNARKHRDFLHLLKGELDGLFLNEVDLGIELQATVGVPLVEVSHHGEGDGLAEFVTRVDAVDEAEHNGEGGEAVSVLTGDFVFFHKAKGFLG